MGFRIIRLPAGKASECEAILRSLPKWFGIEEAIVHYRSEIEREPTWVTLDRDTIIGFITLKQYGDYSAEIYVMGVRAKYHRKGVGRALVERVEDYLRLEGVEYLQVKTLAPSRESSEYARTRKFYLGLGFRPLEENELWGKANPCLILVKRL